MSESITILGSTGSVGRQTLDVISRHPDKFQVTALTAKQNDKLLLEQCKQYRPEYAVLVDADAATRLKQAFKNDSDATNKGDQLRPLNQIQVLSGSDALDMVATKSDRVMAAIVGAAGLSSTMAAVKAGKKVLLANKEPLVMAGKYFMAAAKGANASIIPVDSEHNAIFQCLPVGYQTGTRPGNVEKLTLTASGGPFRQLSLDELNDVTPEQAVNHPTWNMGAKISVDSATMMNKGFEVIEAHWLFNMPLEKIEVILHPQSIIHSMVAYCDGSTLAQLGDHDMRVPITSALAWPTRFESGVKPLDFTQIASLDFEPVDLNKYPCLKLAYQAMQSGSEATTILNAANEVAVDAFLNNQITYLDIPKWIEQVLTNLTVKPAKTLSDLIDIDQQTRQYLADNRLRV